MGGPDGPPQVKAGGVGMGAGSRRLQRGKWAQAATWQLWCLDSQESVVPLYSRTRSIAFVCR